MKIELAHALDPSTVEVEIPEVSRNDVIGLLAKIERLPVSVDSPAKIVIDESSGTIVIGENVKLSKVAVSQGNLTIKIDEAEAVSQPGAFAPKGAQTVSTPSTSITIDDKRGVGLTEIKTNATLKDLVDALNSLGVAPRDLISIVQNIKAAGALQADIEAR
jgi:flagellar P-ring protein precursor FlgI